MIKIVIGMRIYRMTETEAGEFLRQLRQVSFVLVTPTKTKEGQPLWAVRLYKNSGREGYLATFPMYQW